MRFGFGIDVGGTTVKLAYFDDSGKMLDKWEIPTNTDNNGIRVLPDIADLECGSNQRKKLCNSSIILKKIIQKIAEIKHEESESVENSIFKNTVDLFNLEIKE